MNNENTFYDFKNVRCTQMQDNNYICEGEFALPDYYGDISSIIAFDMTPKIISKKYIAQKSDLECVLEIRVIGINGENRLFSYEYKYNFVKSIEGIREEDLIFASVKTVQTVCRQSAERKIYFKAELDFNIEVCSNDTIKLLLSCEDNSVKYKKEDYSAFSKCSLYEKQEVYNDIISLNKPMNDVKTVIRKYSVATVNDCKIISKKALIKGEIKNDFIYIDITDNIQKLRTVLPYSYVIDINEEETNDIKYFAQCEVYSTEISPNTDDNNTFSSYSIKFKLNLSLNICTKNDFSLISDLYSTEYDTDIKKDDINVIESQNTYQENIVIKKEFELPQDISNIYDAWFYANDLKCNPTQDGISIIGDINLNCLCSLKNDGYTVFSAKTEFEYKSGNIEPCGGECKAYFVPYECEFSVNGNKLSVKFEGNIVIKICNIKAISVVTQAQLLPQEQISGSQIIVYYPDDGEDTWEIAKRFKADTEDIFANPAKDGDDNISAYIIQR